MAKSERKRKICVVKVIVEARDEYGFVENAELQGVFGKDPTTVWHEVTDEEYDKVREVIGSFRASDHFSYRIIEMLDDNKDGEHEFHKGLRTFEDFFPLHDAIMKAKKEKAKKAKLAKKKREEEREKKRLEKEKKEFEKLKKKFGDK